ncbi:16667_t:CDS:1, partial [Dentiscutata erythropus]
MIAPKFPPTVDISKKFPNDRIPARAPNAFITLKVNVETARESGHYLPTIVPSMASQSREFADDTITLNKNERRRKNKSLKNNIKSIKEIKNNKNIESRDTKPVILVTSSHNINSTAPVFTNNPSNLDSSIISSMESQ